MNPSETPHEGFKLPPKGSGEQGFKAPEGYFTDFSARLQARIQVEAQPETSDPILSQGNRGNIYQAPEGYFSRFPDKIMALIRQAESATKIRSLNWYERPAVQWAVAATITLFVVVGIGLSQRPTNAGFDDFSTDELLAMVESEQVETDLIMEIMDPLDIPGSPEAEINVQDQEDIEAILEEVDIEDLEAVLLEETL
ncbi:MAG: hypothetical protein AAFV07_16120 [Bacteroidota bacterium]